MRIGWSETEIHSETDRPLLISFLPLLLLLLLLLSHGIRLVVPPFLPPSASLPQPTSTRVVASVGRSAVFAFPRPS